MFAVWQSGNFSTIRGVRLWEKRSVRIIKDKVLMGVRLNGGLFVKATPTSAEDKVSNEQTGLTNVSRLWSVRQVI